MIRALCLTILLFAIAARPDAARAAEEPATITYTVQPGDTLLQLARDYMIDEHGWREVQRLNSVVDPHLLSIGRKLKLPRRLLRHDPVELRVGSFSGDVRIDGTPVSRGDVLRPQGRVETGPDGFVTLTTDAAFGGRVSMPSNSAATLVRARRYVLGATLYLDFRIERGRGRVFSPSLQGEDQLLLTTPRAVTAVRGTQFRVAFDPEGDSSITEVTEGAVAVAAGDDTISAEQGFGIRSTAQGLSEPEALLPAPILVDPTAIQLGKTLDFKLEAAPQASAYRVQIGRDANLLDVIAAQIVKGDTASFAGLEDGRYFVRARAISANGIEGFSSDGAGFRRKRIGVSASSGPAQGIDGFLFKWAPEGEPDARFAFQMWPRDDRGTMLVNETGLDITAIVLTDVPPGEYTWRVAAIVPDEEEGLLKVWSPEQTLTLSE